MYLRDSGDAEQPRAQLAAVARARRPDPPAARDDPPRRLRDYSLSKELTGRSRSVYRTDKIEQMKLT